MERDSSSTSPVNPFNSEVHTLASGDSGSDRLSVQSDTYLYPEGGQGSRVMTYENSRHYDGAGSSRHPEYLTPGTAAGAAAGAGAGASSLSRNSSASFTAMDSSDFDRYPNRISSAAPSVINVPLLNRGAAGAAAAGGAAGAAAAAGAGPFASRADFRDSAISNSGSSVSSIDHDGQANPFLVNGDFSPFGGYPASSFPLHLDEKEADDYLHNPDPILDAKYNKRCQKLDRRGWASVIAFIVLVLGILMVFIVLPVLTFSGATDPKKPEVVEILTQYTYPQLSAIRTSLVDPDTPEDAHTRLTQAGDEWQLVFSDEFAVEGRTFYDGDDQFFQAIDFNYAATNDLEWYSPDAASTANGTLNLRLDAFKNHNLYYRSAMMQSWNKLCFTQGLLEVSALLPGSGSTPGLWPGIWTMGNLGRPGYMATTEGVWPYSYNECDAGITANQSSTDGISYLPGQKLNSCTCPGRDHPNEGTGRGAPEIDALEGTVNSGAGIVANGVASQSLQVAPYDIWYMPNYDFLEIYNFSVTHMNTYCGGPFQQAISGVSYLNTDWYELGDNPSYQTYGFEYLNDDTNGYIKWFVGSDYTYGLYAPALGPNGNVGHRPISKEPMSIILNLGISNSWTYIDWNGLTWPSTMHIDYVRIYQPSDAISVTCDPSDYPTYDYIQDHPAAYEDYNATTWAQAGYAFPPNKLTSDC